MAIINKREIVAIVQVVVMALCVWDVMMLVEVTRFPDDIKVLEMEVLLLTTAIMCILFALSTWFYSSSLVLTRFEVRVFSIILLSVLAAILLQVSADATAIYKEEYILGYFEREIYDEEELATIAYGGSIAFVICIIIFVMNIILVILEIIKLVIRLIRKLRAK